MNEILEKLENEINKEDNEKQRIQNQLGSTPGSNQEVKAIKAKFSQIIYSNKLIKDEQEAKKDIFKALDTDHGIPVKIAKKVEKLLEKGSVTEFNEEMAAIEQLYEKVRS